MDNNIPLPPFYSRYVNLASNAILADALLEGGLVFRAYAASWTQDQAEFRYAQNKWSPREILLHLLDSERVFAYRAMRFGRGDNIPLPGFDENDYAQIYAEDLRSVEEILKEMRALRESTVAMFKSFSQHAMERKGEASGIQVDVRSIGQIIVGHEIHHLKVLQEKYFPM